jgi:hypothetical protein
VPEIHAETPETALANTRLTDRELLIHAIQHLEVLAGQVGEIYAALEPLRPLLEKLASRRRLFP